MSPSWRERFEIALRPDEVAVRHVSSGWRPKEALIVRRVTNGNIVDALANALDEYSSNRRIRAVADIVLAEPMGRCALVPWSAGVRGKSERAALLRACFEDLYGSDIGHWPMVADRGLYGAAAPAYAAEGSLMAEMGETLARRGIRMISVAPSFAAIFNRHHRRLMEEPAVFAVVDSGWATLATFHDREWNSLRSVRLPDDPVEIGIAVAREAVLQGLPDGARLLVCSLTEYPRGSFGHGTEFVRPWGTIAQPGPSAALLPGRWPR